MCGPAKAGLYLALAIVLGPMADNGSLLDLHSRRVIGWAVSNRMKRDLGDPSVEDGHRVPATAQGLHSSHGSWVAILFTRLPEAPAPTWVQNIDVW